MKKVKILQNYYSRLTFTSLLSAGVLVFSAALILLIWQYSARTAFVVQEYGKVLQELEKNYIEIWNNYYKVFVPLMDDMNAHEVWSFCKAEDSGYKRYTVQLNFKRVLAGVCREDERIWGVYFRRFADGARYLYSDEDQQLTEVFWDLGNMDATEEFQRDVIGGRRLKPDDDSDVFGIQSGILSSQRNGEIYKYQISILYDLSSFERIVAKYDPDPRARFLITSPEGKIIFDSQGAYGGEEDSYFENMGKVMEEAPVYTDGVTAYQKEVRTLERSGGFVFYLIPQHVIAGFQFNGTSGLILLLAGTIIVVLSMVMVSVNRLANRKFRELEKGMHQVGGNNLHYRLPIGEREDEFARIAVQFNKMCDDLEDIINKNYIYHVLQQSAEYKALQTCVNPHFLYNSLEALREELDKSGHQEGAEMVLLLSRIFEYQIRGDNIVTIQKEALALQNYIDFASIRYRYAFDYSIDFAEEILDCAVPKQISQPVVENYFVHGLRGDGTDYIRISGYKGSRDGMIHICFYDNGKGLREEQVRGLNAALKDEETGAHIGLKNVNSRLKILFGKESRVEVTSNAPEPGACVLLVFGQTMKLDMKLQYKDRPD